MDKIIKEFKEFAIDLAIGVIIGGAFGKIVTSLVNDIIMPPLGLLIGGVDFADKVIVLKKAVGDDPAVVLSYGVFINAVINFLIIAWAIFLMVRYINKLKKKEEESPKEPKKPSEEVQLLTEIRDSLRR